MVSVAQVEPGHSGLGVLDYAVIAGYFALMLVIGYGFSRRQSTGSEYFLAGRSMPWIAVGLSMFATLLSTISYLAVPGEIIQHGLGFLAGLFALPVVFLFVGYIVIPYFMRLEVTSAYEYLEQRFNLTTRLLASILFVLIRVTWMGLIVYTASLALVEISDIPFTPLVLGLIAAATIYTVMGGMRAVIWTDVIQCMILFGGAAFVIVYIGVHTGTGPVTWWYRSLDVLHTSQPFFSFDPFVRVTLVGMVIRTGFFWVCTAGADQVVVQRYLCTSSASAARRAFACNLIASVVLTCFLALCGLALYSFYAGHISGNPDDIFPQFIRHRLPRGFAGLIVAALFAASMSSMDSGMNSIAAVVIADGSRLCRTHLGPKREVIAARSVTLIAGLSAAAICFAVHGIPAELRGNITDVTNQTSSFMVGSLGGLFFIAMFVPRCNGFMGIISTLFGCSVGFVVALGHWLFPFRAPISWMWVVPMSCTATVASGMVLATIARVAAPSWHNRRKQVGTPVMDDPEHT